MARTYRRTRLRKRAQQRQTTTSFPVLAFVFMALVLTTIVWMVLNPR